MRRRSGRRPKVGDYDSKRYNHNLRGNQSTPYGHRGEKGNYSNVQNDLLDSVKAQNSGNRHSATIKGKNNHVFRTRASQLVSNSAVQIQSQLTPESTPSNGFSAGNVYMDVEISPSNQIHYLNDYWLELTVRNPSLVDNMWLNQQSLLFNRIEFLPNSGDVQDTWYDLHQYLMSILPMNDEKRAMEAANMGINRDTNRDSTVNPYTLVNYDNWNHGAGIVLGPGEQYTFNIRHNSIFKNGDIFLPALTSWPRIRYWFDKDNCQMAGSPALANNQYPYIEKAVLKISGDQLEMDQANAIRNYYGYGTNSIPTISYGIAMDRQILNQFTPTSGQETSDLTLNSTSGKMAGFFLIVRKYGVKNEDLLSPAVNQTWLHVKDFTFKQADGTTISYEKQPADYFRSTRWTEQWPSNLALEKSLLWYNFCSDPMAAIFHGQDTGSYQFTNKEVIKFTPLSVTGNTFPALLTPAYEPIIIALRYCQLVHVNGVLNLDKISDPDKAM